MNVSLLKLKIFYKIFIASPKQWQKPKKGRVLIYDQCGSEVLTPYLTRFSFTTMAVRGEQINVPCMLLAMLSFVFWRGKPLKAYTYAFIQATSPEIILTFIDNNRDFYEVSEKFTNVKTILLQNGLRDNWLDACDESYDYYVDYMLVFGSSIATYYRKHLLGEVLPVGSIKNNEVGILNVEAGDGVLFISQWHNEDFFHFQYDGIQVYWDQFFFAEVIVLKFLDEWCAKNNKFLKVCGRGKDNDGLESFFYKRHLNSCAWQFLPKNDNYSSYKLIDEAEIVVSIDSTLGYESIARGKKTAILSCRGSSFNSDFRKFGWPSSLSNNGPFWTNDQEETQYQRIIDYLNAVSDDDWEKSRQQYAHELMEFDPGNKRFVALLDQLLHK